MSGKIWTSELTQVYKIGKSEPPGPRGYPLLVSALPFVVGFGLIWPTAYSLAKLTKKIQKLLAAGSGRLEGQQPAT